MTAECSTKMMAPNKAWILGALTLAALLSPWGAKAIQENHVIIQAEFAQTSNPEGEFMFDFDGDEIFHVDMDKRETVWRLTDFSNFASFEAQGALANLAVDKANLEIMMKRSNNTSDTNVPPEVTVFPKGPVELGHPNVLVCFIDKFSPPVLNVTWLQNGKPITDGVFETVFLPRADHSFRKFHYLTFIPSATDFYDCEVDHWGLEQPTIKHWEPEVRTPLPETTETVVCALGLAVGLVGIIAGTILFIKAKRSSNTSRGGPRGPL
ncbi:mamu class II histocompatibility antigen, DR alpha chain-like [Monodelphis domestica]|uniref:mamu class II histocompatibility antigen, DR alpha chain-like n=1 Tax=Monodelphis domestica TaxID=13616 RepID=UPI0024E26997|nr:mamu class II histocompatibility antigen, DR alpha chain-like [Monodelphis domestica]